MSENNIFNSWGESTIRNCNRIEFANKNIFLADDDPDDRDLFTLALESISNEFYLSTFKNGQELMDGFSLPEFLDINMPVKNGLEALAEIRSNSKNDKVPIVIYSTSSNSDLVNSTHLIGADLYLVKPSDFSRLNYCY